MPVDRQYRPKPTGNVEQDHANRQIIDHIYDLRSNYGPVNLFAKGSGASVTVPNATTKPATGIGVQTVLSRPGSWVVSVAVQLSIAGDGGSVFTVFLAQGSVVQSSHNVQWSQAGDGTVAISQSWQLQTKGNENIRILIQKDTGAGTSSVTPSNSTIAAMWMGPT